MLSIFKKSQWLQQSCFFYIFSDFYLEFLRIIWQPMQGLFKVFFSNLSLFLVSNASSTITKPMYTHHNLIWYLIVLIIWPYLAAGQFRRWVRKSGDGFYRNFSSGFHFRCLLYSLLKPLKIIKSLSFYCFF